MVVLEEFSPPRLTHAIVSSDRIKLRDRYQIDWLFVCNIACRHNGIAGCDITDW
jgi:hypothetical protein